jgi:hypothetical protein
LKINYLATLLLSANGLFGSARGRERERERDEVESAQIGARDPYQLARATSCMCPSVGVECDLAVLEKNIHTRTRTHAKLVLTQLVDVIIDIGLERSRLCWHKFFFLKNVVAENCF